MKHGKRPTVAQKKRLQFYKLNPDNWLITKDCSDCFEIVNRVTGKVRALHKIDSSGKIALRITTARKG